jgi:multicomponent Na+:H+ antiporter subunit D
MTNNYLLLLPPALPAIAAILVLVLRKRPAIRDCVPVIGAVLTFLSVLQLAPAVLAGQVCRASLFTLLPGITVALRIDGMGLLFAGTASFLWIAASLYCIGYMRMLREHAQTRFYVCYAVAVGGAMGVAFSENLFTLYLFYEIVSIFTYPLVAHHQDGKAYDGARKYLTYLMFASKALLLPAMAIIYITCGTLDFNMADIHRGIFPAGANPAIIQACYFMMLFGFAKAAIMPFHGWLPAAMVAPTPVSALLHAVVVVKVGVFSVCRMMLSLFGTERLASLDLGIATAWIAAFTILTASIIAMTKTDLKARLAYSTVSQLSYIVLGVAMLVPSGVTGGLIHIANHAFSKISLFFCAGAIICATSKTDIRTMGGLARQMPATLAVFAIAALSMIGVPPVGGFVSKWFLAVGALDIKNTGLLAVILVSSILNAYYFGEVILRGFFGSPPEGEVAVAGTLESTAHMRLMIYPMVAASALSVVWGLYPDLFLKIIRLKLG